MKNLIGKISEKYKEKPNFHLQQRNITNLQEYINNLTVLAKV
jgi:hypothetical protein